MNKIILLNKDRTILTCSADESNHGNGEWGVPEDRKIGEVIVVTFSYFQTDISPQHFTKKRDYSFVDKWIEDSKRDYLFTLLIGPQYQAVYSNLPFAVPRVIDEYLRRKGVNPSELNIFLDGKINRGDKKRMANYFSTRASRIKVDDFPKSKGIFCPTGVYVADAISHYLYTDVSLEKLLKDERFVSL